MFKYFNILLEYYCFYSIFTKPKLSNCSKFGSIEYCKPSKQPVVELHECRVNTLLSACICIGLLCIRSMFIFLPPPTLSFHLSVSRFARSISVFQSWSVVLEESCDECGSGQVDLRDNPCFLVAKIHQRLMRRPTGPVIQHSRWVFVMRLWEDRTGREEKTRAAHAGFILQSPHWVFLSPPGTTEISHLDVFFSTFQLSYFAYFSLLFFHFFLPVFPLSLSKAIVVLMS